MKVVALFAVIVGVVYSDVDVPYSAATAVRNAGMQVISDAISVDNQRLVDAIEAFKPINASCNAKINGAISNCRTCVESKCKNRAESVCKPEEWQRIFGKIIGFFTDGIPKFFSKSVPDIFVDKIGGGFIDITKDVADFFKDKIGAGLVDVGKAAVGGVIDFGKGLGKGVLDVGKTVGNGILGVGKTIGDGFGKAVDGIKHVGNAIKDIGGSVIKAFGSLFGKRELVSHESYIRSRRQGEPGCKDFENNPEQACKFYLKAAYCPDCGFNADTMCDGYKAATDAIKAANAQRTWMTKVTEQKYEIVKISFNPTAISANGAFNDVYVSVKLFGKDLQFSLGQPINPYIPTTAGPIIARRALEEFKKA